jgi:hypothetical protein
LIAEFNVEVVDPQPDSGIRCNSFDHLYPTGVVNSLRFTGIRRTPRPTIVVGVAVSIIVITLTLVRLIGDSEPRRFPRGVVHSQVTLHQKGAVNDREKDAQQHRDDKRKLDQALPGYASLDSMINTIS